MMIDEVEYNYKALQAVLTQQAKKKKKEKKTDLWKAPW